MTDWEQLARPSLRGLARYDPGPTRDALREAHGLEQLEPLNWNEDLFGPPAEALEAAAAEVMNASRYPERAYADFRSAAAAWLGVEPARVIPGHGSQALIGSITAAFLEPGVGVVVPALTYGLYGQVSAAAGARVTRVPPAGRSIDLPAVAAAARQTGARLVWLCDPNNPTGELIDPAAWSRFLDQLPDGCAVVADEAYMDFADPALRSDRLADVAAGRPVIVLRSFSKIFGLAGLRLGCGVADPQVARLLDVVQEPFNVNRVALAAGCAALAVPGFVERRRAEVAEARRVLIDELDGAGITAYPSHTNFVLLRLGERADDRAVCAELLRQGLLVRGGSDFGLPGHLRVTAAPPPVMRRAAQAVAALAGG
jgi:histidinol-phosphate aminotransferase